MFKGSCYLIRSDSLSRLRGLDSEYSGTFDAIERIWKEESLVGFYKGNKMNAEGVGDDDER